MENHFQSEESYGSIIGPPSTLAQLYFTTRFKANLFFNNSAAFDIYKLYLEYLIQTGGRNSTDQRISKGSYLYRSTDLILPSLNGLEFKDLIKVRQNEVMFVDWRTALGKAMERLENENVMHGSQKKFQQLVEDELLPAKLHIEQEIRKSSILSKGKSAGIAFALGAMGGAFTGELINSIISGSVVGAGLFIKEYLELRKELDTNRAFLGLYNSLLPQS